MRPEPTTVKIFGQDYTIRAEGDPDYVRRIADYLDRRMHEVARQSNQVSSLRVAILAALNITDELFQARESGQEDARALRERAEALAAKLEATILSAEFASDGAPDVEPDADPEAERDSEPAPGDAAEGERDDDVT